jgi:flagellar biosynthesis protein FlhF
MFGKQWVRLHGCIAPLPDLTKYAAPLVMGRGLRRAVTSPYLPPDGDAARDLAEKQKILEQARGAVQQSAGNTLNSDIAGQLLEEMRSLKKTIAQSPPPPPLDLSGEHPAIIHINRFLEENKFTPAVIQSLIDRLKTTFSIAELDNIPEIEKKTLQWIGESLLFYDEAKEKTASPRIFVLIGPTGVGKTTTLAKIAFASMWPEKFDGKQHDKITAVGRYKQKVVLLSIDQYRIGAGAQIEKYGELIHVPYQNVRDEQELHKEISFHRENADIILVDTFGNNPYEAVKLAEMKEFLAACGPDAEYHLALSAITDGDTFAEILGLFEPFGYRSVVLTKIDEAQTIGALVSALISRGKKLSFVTTGQGVPFDIERAGIERLLQKLKRGRL